VADLSADLVLAPRRGLPQGLVIPQAELVERFSRSSGPGGQSVNTTDSRVELRWDVAASAALTDAQRTQLLARLAERLLDGELRVTASEHRAQLRNREAARARLTHYVADALEPPAPARRASRPSRAAKARRVDAKRRRGELKTTRRRPPPD
jgi:ribosome-associated protein